ncbi:uncharacterized protein [Bemisia tabaci]|uniref:uncharacterized protein n=1 Tax=Bemisia tabaci TaxID=7038 RepID=UPI003B287F40
MSVTFSYCTEWSRTVSASRPQTEEELAAQERSEREVTEQRNRLLASLWNQNKGQSSKEPSQKRPSSPKQSGPRPFDPQEVAKDGRGKVVYATSLNDPRARGLAQGIPQNTSAGPRSPKKSLEWRRETSIPKPRGPNGQQVPSSGATTQSAPPRQMRTISGHPLPSSSSSGVAAPKPQPPSGKSVPNFDYVCEGGKCTIKYAETIPEENLPK